MRSLFGFRMPGQSVSQNIVTQRSSAKERAYAGSASGLKDFLYAIVYCSISRPRELMKVTTWAREDGVEILSRKLEAERVQLVTIARFTSVISRMRGS